MIKTYVVLSLFLVLCVSKGYNQSNYIKGYYIDNEDKTHYGFIDFKDWERNPYKIKFKEHNDSLPSEFSPKDITEFQVDGNIFISATIEVEGSPDNLNNLMEDPAFVINEDIVFLKVQIKGEKNLFLFTDKNNKKHMYYGDYNKPELLLYKKYLKKIDNKYQIKIWINFRVK